MIRPSIADEMRVKWQERCAVAVQSLAAQTVEDGYSLSELEGRHHLANLAIKWDLMRGNRENSLFIALYLWPEIERLTGIDRVYIFDHIDTIQELVKKEKHDKILADAFAECRDFTEFEQFGAAKTKLTEAFERADAALNERPPEPIRLVSDCITDLRFDLLDTQGKKYTGYCQKSLPDLDDATGGFRGLTLLAGKSGEGKTILALQNTLDVLRNYEDICAVILSMDMLQTPLLRRMASHCALLPLSTVRSGTTPTGWTEEERTAVERGLAELQTLGNRIKILDRFNFSNPNRQSIIREMARHMELTGKSHCILVVDLVELLPTPERLKSEYDRESWQIDEFRTIADSMNEDPLLGLCKAGKGDAVGNAMVKGNADKVQRSDMVITIESFKEEELLGFYDINNGYITLRAKKEIYKEKDAAERAKEIRKALQQDGKSPMVLSVTKGRDGAKKTSFNVVNHFEKNMFRQMG